MFKTHKLVAVFEIGLQKSKYGMTIVNVYTDSENIYSRSYS